MSTQPSLTFRNPLLQRGADPWMVFHQGFYYLSATGSTQISMRRARSIAALAGAEDVIVWQDETPSRALHMWAPEFYLLDGPNGRRWYLYYTASSGREHGHRLYVLEGGREHPLQPYQFKAQLATDPRDELFGIDAGLLQTASGELFFLWAGQPGHELHISAMENPWTLSGERVHLPAAGFGCAEVREGPVCLRRGGQIFLVYSACDAQKPDYKLGMLIAQEGADLLSPASWRQHPRPMFERCDENNVFGPGHNGFFTSPDGSEDWIIYHAKDTAEFTFARRSARAQKFRWNADGTPNFGVPLALEADVPLPSGDPGAED